MRRLLDPSGQLPTKAWRAAACGLVLWIVLVTALACQLDGNGRIAPFLPLGTVMFPSLFLAVLGSGLPEGLVTKLERRDRVSLAVLISSFVFGAGFAAYGIVVGSITAGYLAFPAIGLALIISRLRLLSLATLEQTT